MSYAAICPTVNVATADEAALILRKKIGLRLKGGPHGLMRCWLQFRERAGGSKDLGVAGMFLEQWRRKDAQPVVLPGLCLTA